MIKKLKNAFKHIRNLIVNPKRYFTKIVADGNMEESMMKAFLYGLLGGCLVLLIRLMGGATITIGAIFTAIIIVPVLAVALLFVMGGLMMLMSEITGGERDWEIAIKGLASVFFIQNWDVIKSEMAKVLKADVQASFSKKVAGGFTIGPKDGGYFISLTDATFTELISEYLRPATKKILFG